MILIDTNVLVEMRESAKPQFLQINSLLDHLRNQGETLCIVPQCLYEFWSTATRPTTARGLGLSITESQAEVLSFQKIFQFLPDQANLYDEWQRLVVTYQCHGRVSFDARLVAAMNTHQITQILTYNGPDFARFPSIQILDPPSLLLSP